MAFKKQVDSLITGIGNALPGFGENAQQVQAKNQANQKAQCENAGGTWDGTKCIFPPKQASTEAALTPAKTTTQQIGRGVLTSDPQQMAEMQLASKLRHEQGIKPDQVGTSLDISPEQIQQYQQQEQRKAQLLQMAQQGLLTPQELQAIQGANIDVGQALGSGAVGVLPGAVAGAATGIGAGILAGAATGATAGSIVPGVGTVALGALGAIGGFLVAVRSNIKGQQAGEFAADQTALTKGQTMLRSLITDTNQNPQNTPENIALFYQTLNMIDAAHVKTLRDSQESLNKFLGNDGTPQLAKFETFDNSMRIYYINKFNAALANPDKTQNLITLEDIQGLSEE